MSSWSPSDIPAHDYAPARRRRRVWPLALILLLIGAFLVLNCSGLSFPMWDPAGRLQSRLADDAGFNLPGGTVVERASRVAYRDPLEGYLLRMPPGSSQAFADALRQSAAAHGASYIDVTAPPGPAMPLIPSWFHPETIPGVQDLHFSTGRDMNRHWRLFFTPGSDEVYVLWFTT